MKTSPDISVIVTAHREGVIAGVTAKSALAAIRKASAADLDHEVIVVLDRADGVTAATLREAFGGSARYLETDEGDPGLARNRAVEVARGRCATFLDGDDLWSDNWLVEAHRLVERRPDVAAHSACNLVFGNARHFWWHADSETSLCDKGYLDWMNFLDAMSFARTEIYRRYPFRKNDLNIGFGHEDWHWNAWTLGEGVPHKPVPCTMHFKRARSGSQMHKIESMGGFRWPLAL
jgi:glycosyltransferase involved in cell wall biosynthesis